MNKEPRNLLVEIIYGKIALSIIYYRKNIHAIFINIFRHDGFTAISINPHDTADNYFIKVIEIITKLDNHCQSSS